ncbi:MAG: hypothetical protein AB7Q37_18875 [Pyrinomonadaceae bacterium]
MTLMETALINMAQQNVPIDANTRDLIERDMLPRCSRAALDSICAFQHSAVGQIATRARATMNWRRVAQQARRLTPLSQLRNQWNNGSPGMNMLRAHYNNDFAAFAREYFD